MIKCRWIPWTTCAIGIAVGVLASLMWRAPAITVAECPKGLSGIWICTQEWQTLIASLFAIGAATIAFLTARYGQNREDDRRRQDRNEQRRILAISLSAAFDAASYQFGLVSVRAAGIAYRQETELTRATYASARATLAVELPPIFQNSEDRIGVLGAAYAALISNTIQILRNAASDFEMIGSDHEPEAMIQVNHLRRWERLYEKASKSSLETSKALSEFAGIAKPRA
ncbi:MAG: hypothetical protein MI785_14935 [Kiloniellales bacterium]|nr:hypothetical protein [Kiloniellales bacterium]